MSDGLTPAQKLQIAQVDEAVEMLRGEGYDAEKVSYLTFGDPQANAAGIRIRLDSRGGDDE